MTNTLTLQSRIAIQILAINDDVSHFSVELNGPNYRHFVTGLMLLFNLFVIVGKIANADVWQALDFGGKVLGIVIKSVAWGVFGI